MPEVRVLVSGNPCEPLWTEGDTAQWMTRYLGANIINARVQNEAKIISPS